MAKTALELTRQEWRAYRPGATGQQLGRQPDPGLHLRRQRAWRVVRKAAKVLREQYSEAVSQHLDEYRGFRHVVRNVYTFKFDPAKLGKLVSGTPRVFQQVRVEPLAFADFLEQGEG